MTTKALLLSCDSDVIAMVRHIASELGIAIHLLANAHQGAAAVARDKFDAICLDCDEHRPESIAFLQQLRQGPSNRSTVVFAIVADGSQLRNLFRLGATFVLEKPLTLERTVRSFRAAVGLMARERQRYRRIETALPVRLQSSRGAILDGIITNLSERGLAVYMPKRLGIGEKLLAAFSVADGSPIKSPVEVIWSHDDGHAGLRMLASMETLRDKLTALASV